MNHLTSDAQAMLLLCSYLSLDNRDELKPFTTVEWNKLANKLVSAGLRPEDLLELNQKQIQEQIQLKEDRVGRIVGLLERGAELAFELERLNSLGIWIWTRADEDYPDRYKQRLGEKAPPILFCAGDKHLPGQPGLAMVGSRNVSEEGSDFAELIGNFCAQTGLIVYSGGARGVDSHSMRAALEGRGCSVGVMAHSLEKAIRKKKYRDPLEKGNLTLMSPYAPDAGFSVGGAMGRNKLIYTLADYALVIASDYNKGGTWSGATETLRHEWVPVFAVKASYAPEGNQQLIKRGAIPFPVPLPFEPENFREWLKKRAESNEPPKQLDMFF